MINANRKILVGLNLIKSKTTSVNTCLPSQWKETRSVMTIAEVRNHLNKLAGAGSTFGSSRIDRSDLTKSLPTNQDELPAKTMSHSFKQAVIPLSDKYMQEKYTNVYNTIRFGKLLENLDSFAVLISYSHNSEMEVDGNSPLSIVTAMVDEIQIKYENFDPEVDIVMHGHVSWVGKSSLEVYMWLSQNSNVLLDSKFVMVARDANNIRSAIVHPITPETDKEKLLFETGQKSKTKRLIEAKESLFKNPPNAEEREIVHNMFLGTLDVERMSFSSRVLPEDSIWMESTKLKNCIICFPEKRNIHNKIFGGYLMRIGFELAWANACVFSKSRPTLVNVEDILFKCPVPIGSLLLMSSQVCFTYENLYHIRVHAEVMDPKGGKSITSNTFNFTFSSDKPIPSVLPKTYGEAMLYLDGRRQTLHRV